MLELYLGTGDLNASPQTCEASNAYTEISPEEFFFRFHLDRLYHCTFNFTTLSSTTHNLLLTRYNALSILSIEILYLEIWCRRFVFNIGPFYVAFQVDLKLTVFLLQRLPPSTGMTYCHTISNFDTGIYSHLTVLFFFFFLK